MNKVFEKIVDRLEENGFEVYTKEYGNLEVVSIDVIKEIVQGVAEECMIDLQIIKDSIAHYGADMQTTVCMEECAELIQAISKEKRGKHDKYHLIEEIADVSICLEILKEVYCISDEELQSVIYSKQQREVERMTGKKCINESEEYHGCLDGGNKR